MIERRGAVVLFLGAAVVAGIIALQAVDEAGSRTPVRGLPSTTSTSAKADGSPKTAP